MHIHLRFLIAKSLVYLAKNENDKDHYKQALDQIENILQNK